MVPRRALIAAAACLALLAAFPGAAMAQTSSSADALTADAFGVEATGELPPANGADVLDAGPTPEVGVSMPPQQDPVSNSAASLGPVPGSGGSAVERIEAATVTARGSLDDGRANAVAQTADVALLNPGESGPLITADALKAVSTSTCNEPGTLADAADGSEFVNLQIDGESVTANSGVNQEFTIPNLATVVVNEVVPDDNHIGFTVRALHVFLRDPTTNAVTGEVIVGEAHSNVVCAQSEGSSGDVDGPNPLSAQKSTPSGQPQAVSPSDRVDYDVSFTNAEGSGETCTITEVIDHLPDGVTYVDGSASGDLADAGVTATGDEVVFDTNQTLEAGQSLEGGLAVRVAESADSGTIFDDVEARSSCGTARTGPTAPVEIGESTERQGGDNRVDTSVEVSQNTFESATAAVLARSDEFPDALAGAPLATEVDGPILVTPPSELRSGVEDELNRLGVTDVYLAGGAAALQPQVEQSLQDAGFNTIRLAGFDRFETARLIFEEIVEIGGSVEQAVVARSDLFADSLSAGAVATYGRAPIVLTTTEAPVHPQSRQVLTQELSPGDSVFVAGGNEAISQGVATELTAEGFSVERKSGQTRYGTARALVEEAIGSQGADPQPTYLASGNTFVDALVAGPAAFEQEGVLHIVDPAKLSRSEATEEFLMAHAEEIDRLVIVGGSQAIADSVVRNAAEATQDS